MDNKKSKEVKKWFKKHPFVHWFQISLISLDTNSAVISMPSTMKECAQGKIITGGVQVVLGNAAGVAVAMMHSKYFTPLAEIKKIKFYHPIILNKDKILLANAKFVKIKTNRIIIKVEISAEGGSAFGGKDKKNNQLKTEGIFEYALLSKKYNLPKAIRFKK
ncbi:hypothetical protein KJ671_00495 [Patescibacteria group bacterium]|nr:hypothetical protein [Patescibacteria group bacterium]